MEQRITLSPGSPCFPVQMLRLQACTSMQAPVIVWHCWYNPSYKLRGWNNTNVLPYFWSQKPDTHPRAIVVLAGCFSSWRLQATAIPLSVPAPGPGCFPWLFPLASQQRQVECFHTDLHISLALPLYGPFIFVGHIQDIQDSFPIIKLQY